MTLLTHDSAKAYVNSKLTEWGHTEFVIINATSIHQLDTDTVDVTFTLPGEDRHHIFTVWINIEGEIYGEW